MSTPRVSASATPLSSVEFPLPFGIEAETGEPIPGLTDADLQRIDFDLKEVQERSASFAIADIETQSANVTFEKKAHKFKLEGIKGKIFHTTAFNNPRFFFVPAKASCGRSGIIRVFYKTKQPKETFETVIGVSVLGDAPPSL